MFIVNKSWRETIEEKKKKLTGFIVGHGSVVVLGNSVLISVVLLFPELSPPGWAVDDITSVVLLEIVVELSVPDSVLFVTSSTAGVIVEF